MKTQRLGAPPDIPMLFSDPLRLFRICVPASEPGDCGNGWPVNSVGVGQLQRIRITLGEIHAA